MLTEWRRDLPMEDGLEVYLLATMTLPMSGLMEINLLDGGVNDLVDGMGVVMKFLCCPI